MNSKVIYKQAGALILVCAMFMSLCGCSMFSKKDVLAAAKEVAENIQDFDADKLLDLSTMSKNGDKADDLRKGLNGEYLDDATLAFCTAVRKTIRYEIREETFTAKGKEASVEIEFSLADYKSLLKKDFKNIDELVAAVKNCDDTIKVTYEARFVKEDGQWLLDNLMGSSFLGIFEFMDADIGALAVDLTRVVSKATWSGASDGTYKNTRQLSLTVDFSSEITKLKGKGIKMTYSVSKDGKDVWKSEPIELGDKTTLRLDYGTEQNPDAELRSNYLAAGTYKFTLTADNGTVLNTSEVKTTVAVTETGSGASSKGYKFYDSVFSSKVLLAAWVNIDNKRVNNVSYGSDALSISFQMQVDPSMTDNVYFAYYYAATVSDAMKIKVRTDTPLVSAIGKPIVNDKGTFFALGLKTKTTFKPGIYILAIFSEDKQTLLGLAECQILSKPAADYRN